MLCDLILVAGGSGERFSASIPKQFQLIFNKPLYLWSLEVFLSWPSLGEVILVVPQEWVKPVEESFNILIESKKIHVVSGGSSRQKSAQKGLQKLIQISQNPWVAIHDAARPCLTTEFLDTLWKPCIEGEYNEGFGGVVPGVTVNETVKTVNAQNDVVKTLNRTELRLIQTPQILKSDILNVAYDKFDDGLAVDDSMLVEQMGYRVLVIPSSYDNLKVTFNEDIDRVQNWIRKRHPQI
jgi:2-C-methyl-D-erythritol 4-phosphate cytidylyltransferase